MEYVKAEERRDSSNTTGIRSADGKECRAKPTLTLCCVGLMFLAFFKVPDGKFP